MGRALGPYRGRKRRSKREGLGARQLGRSVGPQNSGHTSWGRKRRRAADVGDWAGLLGRRAKARREERMRGGAGWWDVWAPSFTALLGHGCRAAPHRPGLQTGAAGWAFVSFFSVFFFVFFFGLELGL